MSNVVPFVFKDDLVRVVEKNGEPWFVGNDVCRVLEIKNSRDAFKRLDEDEKGVGTADTLGGVQEVVIVSEAGIFRLTFSSRKPQAEEFKRWLAHEVLPALRRDGFFAVKGAEARPSGPPSRGDLIADANLDARVGAIRLGARLFGLDRARLMWAQFGLPTPPAAAAIGVADSRRCLAQLLAFRPEAAGGAVHELIERAVYEADELAAMSLRVIGIEPMDDAASPGFVVGNQARAVVAVFEDGEWAGDWRRALRRLPGAVPSGRYQFEGRQMRGTFIPASYLDVIDDGGDPRWSDLPMP